MSKRIFSLSSFLVLLLVFQLIFPIVNTYAETNSSILPPSNLSAQLLTPEDVKLTWSPVYGATGYIVYEITDGQLILLGKATTTSYTLNNLPEGSYSYIVSTLSSEGESGPCAPVQVDIVYPDMAAPGSLTHTLQNVNNIVLSWSASQYAEKYNLYQISGEGQKTLLTSQTGRSYTVSNAPEGTYKYAVAAENSMYGESTLSTSVEVEVVFPTMQAPGNPTYSITNGNDLTMKWNTVLYATSYKVYQIIDEQPVLKSTVTGTSVTYNNMPAGDYLYKLRSYSDRFGESVEGSTISLTMGDVTMAPPNNFTYKIQNLNDIVLNWGSVPNATNYKVYQITDGQKVLKSTVTGTSVTYTKMPAGDYVYEVHSYSDRFGESAEGSQVTLTIGAVTMAAPGNFAYKFQNINDIVLTWGSVTNATNYKVYQIVDGQKVLKSTVTGTTVTYTNMPAGDYVYEVHSYSDRFGESAEGSQVTLTVEAVTMAPPNNLAYKIQNGNDVVMSWESTANANSYKVYQIVNGQKVLKSTVTGTTVTHTNMSAGDYNYVVHSFSTRFGESQEGSKLSFTLVHPTMQPPANVVQTIKNPTDFTLSWDASEYATSYKVYQIVNGQKTLKSTVTGMSVTYTNMASGEYTYAVYSYSSRFGESAEGTQLTVTLNGKTMLPPTNLTYSIANGNDITLRWTAAQDATSYKIYQVVDGQKVLKNMVAGTSVTYANQLAGEYNYVVHSVSSLFGESSEGAEIKIPLVHPTMAAPGNLTYKIQNGNDVVLNWAAVEYATSYKVYELVDGQKVLKSTVSTLSATVFKVSSGDHTYLVHSLSTRFGESPEGSKLTFTLSEHTMEAPGNLTHSLTNVNTLTLRWDAVSYATSYKVFQIINGEPVLKSTVTGTSVTYTNLPEGDYKYEVHSVSDRFGESPEGSQVSFKVVLPIMQAPGNLTYQIKNGNDVVLNWGAVEYATSYKLYELVDGQKLLKSTVSTLSATITKVPPGEHTYLVHSVSTRFGESPEGSKLTFLLAEHTMEAPENLTYSVINGNDLTLKWDAVTYATSYKVYQIIDGEKVLKNTVTGTSVTYTNLPEGDYKYEVHSVSTRFGESPEGSEVAIKLVFPMMQAPGNLTYSFSNVNNLTLRWTATTYATSYKIYQVIDGKPVLKNTVTSTSVTFNNIPEGDYKYEVHSVSSRFGESPEGSQVSFTMVFPTMQAPGNLTYSITTGNDITLRWNAATYATAYKVYQTINGEKVLVKTVTGTSVVFTNMLEADYKYEIHSFSDRFGESPEGSILNFTLTWPIVQPPQLTGNIFNVNNITLSWNSVTWANEYRVYQITGDNRQLIYKGTALTNKVYNLTEDTHSFEVTAYSTRFGESKPSNRVTERIVYPVMQPPVASLTLLSPTSARISWNFITYANGYNVYEIIDGKPVQLIKNLNNLSYTISNLSYANHEYYVSSYSNSFGESEPSNIVLAKLIVDTEPPVTTANAPTDWTNQNQVVTLSATDNETGVANTYYSLNDSAFVEGTSVAVNGEGVHKVSFYSVDKVGNREETQKIYIKVDQIAPVTKVSEIPEWFTQKAALKLTAMDTHSGVAKTFYSVNGVEYVEGASFMVDKEGLNRVSFYSIDQAGNIEKAQTIEVKIDKTAPVTTSDAPETWSKEDVTVKWSATDTGSGVAKTFYSVNGSEYVEGSTLTIQKEGIHIISFYSLDVAGNREETKTVTVKVDKTAPVLTMNLNEEYKLGTVLPLVYTAIDDLSEIVSEKMIVSGPNLTTGSELANGASLTLDKPGVYTVTVVATNAAGLTTTTEKQFVIYLPATIEVTPKVIKGNNGVFTVRVDLPKGYSSQGFDLNTARLNGVKALTSNNGYYNQAKLGQFKFERADFTWTTREVTLEFRSYVNGYLVVGQTTVKVQK